MNLLLVLRMSVKTAILNLKEQMDLEKILPEQGLGTELFLFTSTLAPVVNVDLLVTNKKHEILLAWRDDIHCGSGWHVPGGCIRFNETLEQRIQRTALSEFGMKVKFQEEPVKVFQIFSEGKRSHLENQQERGHFVTIVYACELPDDFRGLEKKPTEIGYTKWFDQLPENLIKNHECYKTHWSEISNKLWRS